MAVTEETATAVAATAVTSAALSAADRANADRKEKWRLERESITNKRRKITATSNAKVDSVEEGEEQE